MKKALSIILVLLFSLSLLAGCGSKSSDSASTPAPATTDSGAATDSGADTVAGDSSSVDYQASGVQQMGTTRADKATLQATVDWFYDWQFVQGKQANDLRYEDFVKQVGIEANEYEWYEEYQSGVYTWYASDDDDVKITPSFVDGNKYCMACGMEGLKPAYLEELMNK